MAVLHKLTTGCEDMSVGCTCTFECGAKPECRSLLLNLRCSGAFIGGPLKPLMIIWAYYEIYEL